MAHGICGKIRAKNSPDAVHVLADLVRIGALQFAELGVPLDFEEHFVSCLSRHL